MDLKLNGLARLWEVRSWVDCDLHDFDGHFYESFRSKSSLKFFATVVFTSGFKSQCQNVLIQMRRKFFGKCSMIFLSKNKFLFCIKVFKDIDSIDKLFYWI